MIIGEPVSYKRKLGNKILNVIQGGKKRFIHCTINTIIFLTFAIKKYKLYPFS